MLRIGLFLLGLAALVAGLTFLVSGGPLPVIVWLLGLGLILTLGVAYERVRYKSLAARRPGPGWERTEERFSIRDRQAGHGLSRRGWRADVCRGVAQARR
jgi:hypothetical protein